jgi:hypothetical protein
MFLGAGTGVWGCRSRPSGVHARSYGSAYAVNGACWGFPDRDKEYPGKHKCSVRNKALRFLSALPMFVPSLSW